ncbi:hypothetical protein PR202_gb29002 [Eleusine coracana subsp. coracana]|uniref:Suppressor of forked domain-containing protein n=1 Tax=Eleusine coracana subsp. coracana TaxID=191504 RepID=A0AAV5FVW8_ELECO|nr:hypothetical protein PR202_gb29002 [Eleusine coracana subsp. coracana]
MGSVRCGRFYTGVPEFTSQGLSCKVDPLVTRCYREKERILVSQGGKPIAPRSKYRTHRSTQTQGKRDMATPMEEEVPEAAAAAPAPVGGGGDDAEMAAAPRANSDSDDDDGAGADELRIQALEQALQEQPLDYETNVQYIQCLRKSGNIEKLRVARENMNTYFPLTPKMWQEWAKDEISLSTSNESFGDIEKLFERGVQEYLSVNLWRDYLDFVEEHDQLVSQCLPAGLAKMRDLFERAITAGGLHVAEGSKLWAAYREYEMAILITIADANDEEKAKQVQPIRTLFHRQLSVPLADMESTLAEYKSWEAEQGNENDKGSEFDGVPSNIISAYKKANDMYNERKQYEDQLSNAGASEADKLQEFLKYIKFEELKGDPARVQVLYERAVSDLPVSSDIWTEYTSYLDRALKVPSVLKNVYHRATRNCTWVGELWVRYLLSLEHIHASEEELKHVFERAVQCSFGTITEYLDIYLTRVDSLRRRMSDGLDIQLIRQTFMDASEFLSPQLRAEELLLLHSYWTKLERNLGNDVAAARKVWEDTLKKSGSVLKIWQHYISMEIEMGNIHEARSLYKRCYSRRFADSGSEVTPRLKELSIFKSQQEVNIESYLAPLDPSNANDSSHKRKTSKMANKQEPPAKRRKENAPKSTAPSDDQGSKAQIGNIGAVETGEVSGKAKESMDLKADSDTQAGTLRLNESKPYRYNDKCTAYLSNIDLTGLAYVDFSDNEHLEAAIKKNKHKLLGKKVSVARSDPSRNKLPHSGDNDTSAPGSSRSDKEISKDDTKITGKNTFAAPRAVVKPLGWSQRDEKSGGGAEELKSNEEFRNLLLKK